MNAKELSNRRKRLGVTQDELAKLVGVHRVTITRWETGVKHIPLMAENALNWVFHNTPAKGKEAE